MPQVLVWKCPHTGKLFEDKGKYTQHLRKQGRIRANERKLAAAAASWADFNLRMGQVRDIDELKKFIADNWEQFAINAVKQNQWRGKIEAAGNIHKLTSVEIDTARWSESLGNTHGCPRGGVSNFMGHADKPRGYPGWHSRITVHIETGVYKYRNKEYTRDGFGSDYFAGSILETGSGGGGGSKTLGVVSYGYELRLWAHDFPGMYEQERMNQWIAGENRGRKLAWQALGGNTTPPIVDRVPDDWVCPELPPLRWDTAKETV